MVNIVLLHFSFCFFFINLKLLRSKLINKVYDNYIYGDYAHVREKNLFKLDYFG